MKRTIRLACLSSALLMLAGCGGGGGGTDTPAPLTEDDARRAVLTDLGEDLILPTLRTLETRTAALSTSVAALAATPADATSRSNAQTAWRTAMETVERAEVLAVGPAARSSEPGGADLRVQIYAYPLFNRCRAHNAAYADQAVTASSPIDGTGMGSLEALLFDDNDDPACPPAAGVNGSAKRAQHAARVAARIAVVAADLRNRWEPAGGNFLRQFAAAGAGSSVFTTPKMAFDAFTIAIFYTELETKDRKLAGPTGIGAIRLPSCPTTSCPERVESRFARVSAAHIENNLRAFRDVFTGVNGGMGLNALLQGVGRGDLATTMLARIDAALAAEADLTEGLEAAVSAISDRTACVNASVNRTGDPLVCRLHGLTDAATDTLRTDVAAALNLMVPNIAAGDND